MKRKEIDIAKVRWTIGEAAAEIGVETSTIRFWETEFGKLHEKKDRKGNRFFRRKHIEQLKEIHHLLKVRKFTIEGAKQEIEWNRIGQSIISTD